MAPDFAILQKKLKFNSNEKYAKYAATHRSCAGT
jgi:hypothetical protein